MNEWSNAKLCDIANLVLGAFLFFSPYIFGFSTGKPWTNAMMCGLVIVVLSIAALAMFEVWEEWLNLIVGLWVFASPWVLGFTATVAALNVHLVVGFLVAALAAFELWFMHRHPPRQTVGH
jgi:SPW repeat